MNALAFKYGLEKDICSEIMAWSQHTLQKPNPFFNNMTPCPYAKKAWIDGKVAIIFKYEDNSQTIYRTISQFDDALELVDLYKDIPSVDKMKVREIERRIKKIATMLQSSKLTQPL